MEDKKLSINRDHPDYIPEILSIEQRLFAQAWYRQSWTMFESFGLDISSNKLRSGPIMVYLYQQLHGVDWLTKLWCKKVRPRFYKSQQMALEEAYKIISQVLHDEFGQSILDQARKKGLVSKYLDVEKINSNDNTF